MSEKTDTPAQNSLSVDWLVRGALTRFGDIFDRLTGRRWQPSSSLATSELIDKLIKLLEANIRDLGEKGKFVPHNIKLKMQWDKFSGDATDSLKKLETELLSAAVDYINDRHYHTFQPLAIEIKTDYFTEGVKLSAGFDPAENEDEAEAAVDVPVPPLKGEIKNSPPAAAGDARSDIVYQAVFTPDGAEKIVKLIFSGNNRKNVGRTRENDLVMENASISKIHAVLAINAENQLTVADTGSTNGTFLNGQRISYGRAYPLAENDQVSFGTVAVKFVRQAVLAVSEVLPADDGYQVGEFNFKKSREVSNPETLDNSQNKTEILNSADFSKEPVDKL